MEAKDQYKNCYKEKTERIANLCRKSMIYWCSLDFSELHKLTNHADYDFHVFSIYVYCSESVYASLSSGPSPCMGSQTGTTELI